MNAKLFEVRDKGTLIPVLCVGIHPEEATDQERWLMRRAGWGPGNGTVLGVIFTPIHTHPERSSYDPYDWGDRTRHTAHRYIADHWSELESGAVIDVQFILEETPVPKKSEREMRYE